MLTFFTKHFTEYFDSLTVYRVHVVSAWHVTLSIIRLQFIMDLNWNSCCKFSWILLKYTLVSEMSFRSFFVFQIIPFSYSEIWVRILRQGNPSWWLNAALTILLWNWINLCSRPVAGLIVMESIAVWWILCHSTWYMSHQDCFSQRNTVSVRWLW